MGPEAALEEEGCCRAYVLSWNVRHSRQHPSTAGSGSLCCLVKRKLGVLRCLGLEYNRNMCGYHVVSLAVLWIPTRILTFYLVPVCQSCDCSLSSSSPFLVAHQPDPGTSTTTMAVATSCITLDPTVRARGLTARVELVLQARAVECSMWERELQSRQAIRYSVATATRMRPVWSAMRRRTSYQAALRYCCILISTITYFKFLSASSLTIFIWTYSFTASFARLQICFQPLTVFHSLPLQ